MATTKQVWDAVKSILEADVTLKAYVKNLIGSPAEGVWEGEREMANIPTTMFPCIMMGDWGYSEPPYEAGFNKGLLVIPIFGVITNLDVTVQIWSDDPKGIGNFKSDVRNALYAEYPNLGREDVETFSIALDPDYVGYPSRAFKLDITIEYEVAI